MDETNKEIRITFNWDVRTLTGPVYSHLPLNLTGNGLIAYALPHHIGLLTDVNFTMGEEMYCAASLVGPACLVEGSTWTLKDETPPLELRAARLPAPWSVGALAESLRTDLTFSLPKYYQRGAGDTYFSGKMLAKLGRILIVAEELTEICEQAGMMHESYFAAWNASLRGYQQACDGIDLPSRADIAAAAASLRSSLEVWFNGSAETPFVFDSSCTCD